MNTTAEIMRLISNLIRIGEVVEIDHEAERARLETGENLTDWLPWPEQNAAATTSWNPPQEGELWVILSPGGDLAAGIMALRLHTDTNQPPSKSPDEQRTRYPDGTETSYNHETHTLEITIPESGTLNLIVNGPVNVTAPEINLGEPDDLEPSVLGDKLAAALEDLLSQINQSQVIGNLGAPSSPIMAVKPVEVPDLLKGGNSYSTKNRNQ